MPNSPKPLKRFPRWMAPLKTWAVIQHRKMVVPDDGDSDVWGWVDPFNRIIHIARKQSREAKVSTLAHELVHAYHCEVLLRGADAVNEGQDEKVVEVDEKYLMARLTARQRATLEQALGY